MLYSVFREYDIRGLVHSELTPEFAARLGQVFGTYLRQLGEHRVIVGYDNRTSSAGLAEAATQGLVSSGCCVLSIGLVTTPIFYYAGFLYGVGNGIMVTGSHNPPEFNGFKLTRGGTTIHGKELQLLAQLFAERQLAYGSGDSHSVTPVAEYFETIRSRIQLGPRPLKVVVDCGNGTAGLFGPELLGRLGCKVVPLFCESDPRFPNHFPDPVVPANLEHLIQTVRESGADLGVAYDGDGDRVSVVDERGNIIWGDKLMILFWREILPKYPGTPAIVEVKCSQALVDEVTRLGGKPVFYKTGHSLIKAKMKEIGAVFTGEMSGHMFFADEYYGFDDAFYATGRLLRILSHTDQPLSDLVSDIPAYHSTPETRVDCPDDLKFEVVARAREDFRRTLPVIDVDGARVIFPDGWGLIRASNTQPAIVVRCEARTVEGLARIQAIMAAKLAEFPRVAPVEWQAG